MVLASAVHVRDAGPVSAMPHAAVKLIPGVDTSKTPTLNEAAISQSQLIRFIPDRSGGGLVQKLGGWSAYYGGMFSSPVRALNAWEDLDNDRYLGVGAEQQLSVISNGLVRTITPQTAQIDTALDHTIGKIDVSTTSGSALVTFGAPATTIDSYDSVDIRTPVSVGGLVLFGVYPCIFVGPNEFQIIAVDKLGSPQPATSSISNNGLILQFATTSAEATVTVTLDNHGYQAGDTFSVLKVGSPQAPVTVGGLSLFGDYVVENVVSADVFTFIADNTATSTTSAYINSGYVEFVFYIGFGSDVAGSGYGRGGYGRGGYGTGVAPSSYSGTPITASDWALDNWGQIFLASPFDGGIYQWSPQYAFPAASLIPQAPIMNHGMFVAMPQRQIVAYGSTFTGIQDPLLIRWCDVEDYTQWIGLVTNQAGSYRLTKGSRIVGGIQGPQQGMIWTDLGVWTMQYVGLPFVYSFNEVSSGCGLIARKAAGSMGNVVYWMSRNQFFRYSGNGVEPIQCPVWDVAFQDLDFNNLDKIRFAANSMFGEVSWYFPTTGNNGEISHYVKYNVILNQWDYGSLARTAWIDQSVLGNPIGASTDSFIYQHETSPDAANGVKPIAMNSSFQTGYFELSEADVKMFVDQIWPDMRWGYYGGNTNASVSLTFYVTDYPGQTPIVYGPFVMTQSSTFITPRFRGRLVSIKLESSDIGTWWRIGNIRYRYQIDGRV